MMEGRFSDRYPPSEVMSDAAVSERNDSPISIPSASLGTTSPPTSAKPSAMPGSEEVMFSCSVDRSPSSSVRP